jgi:hypothetical protein
VQTIGGAAREVGQFQAVSKLQDAIAGRLEAVHGEVPVHRMLQFGFVDGMGDAHHLAEADHAADPDHPSKDRGFCGPPVVIALLPVLQFVHIVSVAVDGREYGDARLAEDRIS